MSKAHYVVFQLEIGALWQNFIRANSNQPMLSGKNISSKGVIRQSLSRNSQAYSRNGQPLSRNGQSLSRNGQSLSRNGQAYSCNGQSLSRNGQAYSRNGQSLSRNSQAYSRNGQAIEQPPSAVWNTCLPTQPNYSSLNT